LLDAGSQIQPDVLLNAGPGLTLLATPAPSAGLTPAQIRKAYGIDSIAVDGIVGDGSGQTIAILDPGDWPTAYNDLHQFDQQFGLPDPPSFMKLNSDGQASPLPPAAEDAGESALDVEWAHAIAPMAKIVLIESTDFGSSFDTAINTARNLPGVSVVSMSVGGPESNGSNQEQDRLFTTPAGHNGVTFLASTGDQGAPGSHPAFAPNVVAVGGTTLTLNPDNSYGSESGWSGSGGGVSQFQPKPSYQSALPFPNRAIPDVSFDADPGTGVAVFDSFDNGDATPWGVIGGTSLAAPAWAGLIAIIDQERVAFGGSTMDGATETLPLLYSLPADAFHDITTGNNGFDAGPGYDLVTGLGSPVAPTLVNDMAPHSLDVTPTPIDNANAGIALINVQVGQFSFQGGLQATSRYSGTVDWGDGSSTSTIIIVDLQNGSYGIDASHIYRDQGTFTITINISGPDGVSGQATEVVNVASNAPLTSVGQDFSTTEGDLFSGAVATLTDANTSSTADSFTALIDWGDGTPDNPDITQGMVTSKGKGVFTVSGTHTYAEFGSYQVTVMISDKGGRSTTAKSTATVADAALTATGATLTANAGQPLVPASDPPPLIGSFTDGDPLATLDDFGTTVTVDWGDGTTSAGQLQAEAGAVFDIVSTHVYQKVGTYTITIPIADKGGSSVTVTSMVTVQDARINPSGVSINGIEGMDITPSGQPGAIVATFDDLNPFALVGDFSATIDWGDGTTSMPDITDGTVTQPGDQGSSFNVLGSHIYSSAGTFTISVTFVSAGGSKATITSTAKIADAPLTGSLSQLPNIINGTPLNGEVATFTDGNPLGAASDFTASITWGDGHSSDGKVTALGDGKFSISGENVFATPGSFPLVVKVNDKGGSNLTLNGTITVMDASIVPAQGTSITTTEGATFEGLVASFDDAPTATADQFAAVIDWGDGTTSNGQVVELSQGHFDINGTEIYKHDGTFPISVSIKDKFGASATAAVTADILDAALDATADDNRAILGQSFTGVVTQFDDANPFSSATDFTVQITWGDGQVSQGQVVPLGNGHFQVIGSNTYNTSGARSVAVAIHDEGGSNVSATGTIQVLAPLVGGVNTPLITNDNTPVFSGTAQPDTVVQIFAIPVANPSVEIPIGSQTVASSGTWSIGGTTLPDDRYAILGLMLDTNGQTLQAVNLLQSQALTIDTAGPTVKSVQFDPLQRVLHITLHDDLNDLDPAQLLNAANLTFRAIGQVHRNIPVAGITLQPGMTGTGDITEVVTLASRQPAHQDLLILQANGLADRAGNALVEKTFVVFPKVPIPPAQNYVARFTVSRGQASAPELITPQVRRAAIRFEHLVQIKQARPRPNLAMRRPNVMVPRPNVTMSQRNTHPFRSLRGAQ